jgi:hypothetical protein
MTIPHVQRRVFLKEIIHFRYFVISYCGNTGGQISSRREIDVSAPIHKPGETLYRNHSICRSVVDFELRVNLKYTIQITEYDLCFCSKNPGLSAVGLWIIAEYGLMIADWKKNMHTISVLRYSFYIQQSSIYIFYIFRFRHALQYGMPSSSRRSSTLSL